MFSLGVPSLLPRHLMLHLVQYADVQDLVVLSACYQRRDATCTRLPKGDEQKGLSQVIIEYSVPSPSLFVSCPLLASSPFLSVVSSLCTPRQTQLNQPFCQGSAPNVFEDDSFWREVLRMRVYSC